MLKPSQILPKKTEDDTGITLLSKLHTDTTRKLQTNVLDKYKHKYSQQNIRKLIQ
jgi:hypothetical protein